MNNDNNDSKSLSNMVLEAMKIAERKAIEKAIATNTPLVTWQNDQMVEIPPKRLKEKAKELGWGRED